jgi:hypothetical protein
MNFVRVKIRNGIIEHPDFSLAVPVADGDLMLAFRPEALSLRPSKKTGAGIVHRSIDFGTHRIVQSTSGRHTAQGHDATGCRLDKGLPCGTGSQRLFRLS